ncbi:MAG: two-component system, NtrC family, sensor histidine kinase AtoS [Clostridia bacterium]|nr:two-component system, NtrC family, sensor histidine kinase AtoS [Clostridia bacterium]
MHLQGSFDDILKEKGVSPHAGWTEKLWVLNQALTPTTDLVAESFAGVGVGYYSKELDAIVTYGPSRLFGDKVGLPVDENHVGRRCMRNRKEIIAVGSMVRGEIMNCVIPLIRAGEVIGFIWANETLEDIYAQMAQGGMKIFFSPNVEPLLGLTGMLMLASNMLLEVEKLKINERYAGISEHIQRSFAILETYIKLFINSLNLCVIVSDNNGFIRFCSSRLDVWGLKKPEEFLGRPIQEAFKAIGFVDGMEMLSRLADPQKPYQFETISFAGKERDLNVIVAPVKGSEGAPIGVVTIFEDLSYAQKEEERLQRMEGIVAAEQLAVALAHEIRNPLTVLRGAVKLIPERLEDKEYLQKFADVALAEINRVDRIAGSLLELTRYTRPEFMLVNIHDVLRRTTELVRALAREQSVVIVEAYEAPEPVIYGDPEHLQQAFLNLFLNAIQAMPKGGCLTIKTSGEPDSKVVYVKISDTGPGIPKELEDKVFNLFFTTKKQGTGLGLPLAQSIIYRHQGFMVLESEAGCGTTFTIVLPRNLIYRDNRRNRGERCHEGDSQG